MSEKSVGRGVIILAVSSIILKLLSAIYVPLLNEVIHEDGFAIYTVAYRIYTFLLVITSLGIQPAITKVIAEFRARDSHDDALKAMNIAMKYLVIYGGITSIVFAILAVPIAKIINRPEVAIALIFLSPAIVLAAILATYRGYIQAYNEMDCLSISNIIEQIFNVTLSLLFAFLLIKVSVEFGSAGGTIGTSVGAFIAIVYIRYIFKKEQYNNKIFNTKLDKEISINENIILKRLIRYAIPITLVSVVQNMSALMDTVLIGLIFNENKNSLTATLEYFNTIVNVPIVIITSLGIAIFPKIIKGYIEDDKEGLRVQTEYCYKLIYIVIIPSICGLMILSKDIFKFVFNVDSRYELLVFGSIVLLFMAISCIQNIILQGMNIFRYIIKLGIVAMIVKLILNIILMNIEGINVMGAIISSVVAFFIISVVNHKKLQKSFGVKICIMKQCFKPVIAATIMSVSLVTIRVYFLHSFIVENYTRLNIGVITVVLIIIGSAIYGISLLLLGGISKYELDTISPSLYKHIPKILRNKIRCYD